MKTEISRTVRLRQTGLSAGQSQRLETQTLRVRVDRYSSSRTVRAIGADRPLFKSSTIQRDHCFLKTGRRGRGPSAPPGRTVRPLLREGHQKLEFLSRNHMLWGGPSALYFGAQHRNLKFLSRKKMLVGGPSAPEGRTVRPYTFLRNTETPISVQV